MFAYNAAQIFYARSSILAAVLNLAQRRSTANFRCLLVETFLGAPAVIGLAGRGSAMEWGEWEHPSTISREPRRRWELFIASPCQLGQASTAAQSTVNSTQIKA